MMDADQAGAMGQFFGNLGAQKNADAASQQRAEIAKAQAKHQEELIKQIVAAIHGIGPNEVQCPVCGGGAVPNFRKCKNCAAELVWIEGLPCEPEKADEVKQQIAEVLDQQRKDNQRIEERKKAEKEKRDRDAAIVAKKVAKAKAEYREKQRQERRKANG